MHEVKGHQKVWELYLTFLLRKAYMPNLIVSHLISDVFYGSQRSYTLRNNGF